MARQISQLLIFLSLCLSACASPITPQPYPIAPNLPASSPAPPSLASPTAVRGQNIGTLTGRVTIGPLRPGPVRLGETPPPIPPEVYAARTIQIFAADGATLVTNVKINPDGTYMVTLPSGNFVVNLTRTGIDHARGLPKTITISSGMTLTLDIDIDTGIR